MLRWIPKGFKILLIIFFILLITICFYQAIFWDISMELDRITLLLTFIFTLVYQSKGSWLAAMAVFLYGIYYYIFQSSKVAYGGNFEFTLPLIEVLYGDKHGYEGGHAPAGYLRVFPFYYYVAGLIVLMTKRGRKAYWKSPVTPVRPES